MNMCGTVLAGASTRPPLFRKMIKETALGLTDYDSIRRGRYGVQAVLVL